MSNNSSTEPGYLTPLAQGPEYDEELERLLSRWVLGVSGLPVGMVRPRWTPEQAAQPAPEVNWCAFGISLIPADANVAFENQQEESSELWRHEAIECLATFYGPGSQRISTQFRDGVALTQNNDELKAVGLSLGSVGDIIPFPELINNQWVRRYDITVRLRRKIIREYGIKSIVEAPIQFFGE
ncbi:phage neck terminator protein [Serratia fonticola]|nr:Uncharacterised protein [Serratia fonticola]CAI1905261.1 Uncharacterised protein [Serratia fonticola]CAI1926763.1 Uncharacterised protein [Serratia fonticola]